MKKIIHVTYPRAKLLDSSNGGLPLFFLFERSFGELNGAKNGIALSKFSLLSYSFLSLCNDDGPIWLWFVDDVDDDDDNVDDWWWFDGCAMSGNELFVSVTLLLLLSLLSGFSPSSSRHETSARPLIRSSSAVLSSDAKLFCCFMCKKGGE